MARLVQAHAGPNPPVPPLPEAAEQAKTEGNAAFKDGQWKQAIEAYTKAIDAAVSARCRNVHVEVTFIVPFTNRLLFFPLMRMA